MLLPRQTRGDQTERERRRPDESDLVRLRVEQTGGELARVLHLRGGQERFPGRPGCRARHIRERLRPLGGARGRHRHGREKSCRAPREIRDGAGLHWKEARTVLSDRPKGSPFRARGQEANRYRHKFFYLVGFSEATGGKLFSVGQKLFYTRSAHLKGRNRNFLSISNPAFWHAGCLADQSVARHCGWPRKARENETENCIIEAVFESSDLSHQRIGMDRAYRRGTDFRAELEIRNASLRQCEENEWLLVKGSASGGFSRKSAALSE